MCLKTNANSKLSEIKATEEPFFAYSLKLMKADGTVHGLFINSTLKPGLNEALNMDRSLSPEERLPTSERINYGFHLTFSKENLIPAFEAEKTYICRDQVYNTHKVIMIKVKVNPKDVIAVGQHCSGNYLLDYMQGENPALVAQFIDWDGTIEME